ncbi:MAG: hypothetical protein RBT69_03115 [Spirochaetia bacterium]|nr:hypothetical protein [Spirochaetia bacterium]
MKNIKDPRFYEWPKESPYRIYADGKWKGERHLPDWRRRALDYAKGSFERIEAAKETIDPGTGIGAAVNSSLYTLVRELFFLHLTVRESCKDVERALLRLRKYADGSAAGETGGTRDKTLFFDLPFESGGGSFFPLHAWLFSAAVFGQHSEPQWQILAAGEGKRISIHCESIETAELYNFLRGTLIVEGSIAIPGVTSAVEEMERRQEQESGLWQGIAPWHGYNILAHSSHPSALRQLERIEKNIIAMQNSDSSWGSFADERPLATFLMAHALSGRGVI